MKVVIQQYSRFAQSKPEAQARWMLPAYVSGLRTGGRRGMTLLEIIVSMAIFLMALGAIIPLVQMGGERALEVQLQAIALQKCTSKLGELETGSELLTGGGESSFPDDTEGWLWSMNAQSNYNGVNNLWLVQVDVYRELEGGKKVTVSLGRAIVDPSIRGAPLLQPAGTTAPTTTSPSIPAPPTTTSGG